MPLVKKKNSDNQPVSPVRCVTCMHNRLILRRRVKVGGLDTSLTGQPRCSHDLQLSSLVNQLTFTIKVKSKHFLLINSASAQFHLLVVQACVQATHAAKW